MDLSELKLTPKRKEICERLSLENSEDIISYYPFRYEAYEKTAYKDFKVGSQVCFVGELASYPSTFRRGKISTSRFKVLYEDEIINVTIFNRPWIRNLNENQLLTVIGKYDGNNKVTASNYYSGDISGQIIPYYPLKEGVSQNEIKKLIKYTFDKCESEIVDKVPADLLEKHKLIDYKTALINIHNPLNKNLLARSISRLKYEEFLRFYIALDILKGNASKGTKDKKIFDENKINEFIDSLGFELTEDQIKAKDDLLNDLRSEKIMYRLIQGEVGSGKTAVAMIGLYANCLSGYQGALMAPTEILAKQHAVSLKKQLEPYGVKVGVLYSAMDNEKETKRMIADGEIDVIVGTHALFSEDVEYKNLGLVIADEQHRFGVKQRQALKDKGNNCDFVLMSATPIPRTLASSIYGDMDISTIATLPAGRKGCKTILIKKNSIVDILDEVKRKLDEGRQIYVVAAAIDKSDNYKAKDVNGLYNALKDELKPYKTALLHGKLSSEEKDEIMAQFNRNEIQVLVSTTVVEVGVNVSNATMMIIYDADRFGLSQLHQLRGRVQRSAYEGTCYLLTDNDDESVLKRLNILCQSNDGFAISYEDLKLRGPGDILGTRQSGIPAFILGNLIEDTKFIDAAREDARMIAANQDNEVYRNYYGEIGKIASKNFIS
ncbi:MAG: ATP-dependent DNA helicase RecG [Erysipelotrichaceae bacterium]|nr:ATP-dependent DNA helicase RecG [Erysipelotrichaceae bacterium]